jgi:hypothetical protein
MTALSNMTSIQDNDIIDYKEIIKTMQFDIKCLKTRNHKRDLQKSFEGSWTRVISIMVSKIL